MKASAALIVGLSVRARGGGLLPWHDEGPVRPPEERADDDEAEVREEEEREDRRRQDAVPREPDADTLLLPIEVRQQEQRDDEERRDADAAPERGVRHHLLQPEEVPGRLRRVRRV